VTGHDTELELRQPVFSVGLKGVKEEDAAAVEALVLSTLEKLEKEGFGAGAVAIGLGTAYLLPPVQDITLGVLTAFLGGGLLMTTFREELPAASRTRLPWFIGGVTVMAALLLSATVIGS